MRRIFKGNGTTNERSARVRRVWRTTNKRSVRVRRKCPRTTNKRTPEHSHRTSPCGTAAQELVLLYFPSGLFCIFLDFEAVCIFRYFRAAYSIFPVRNKPASPNSEIREGKSASRRRRHGTRSHIPRGHEETRDMSARGQAKPGVHNRELGRAPW